MGEMVREGAGQLFFDVGSIVEDTVSVIAVHDQLGHEVLSGMVDGGGAEKASAFVQISPKISQGLSLFLESSGDAMEHIVEADGVEAVAGEGKLFEYIRLEGAAIDGKEPFFCHRETVVVQVKQGDGREFSRIQTFF